MDDCAEDNFGVDTHEPRSVAEGQPWREIDQNNAKTECTNLGTGYDLISNPEGIGKFYGGSGGAANAGRPGLDCGTKSYSDLNMCAMEQNDFQALGKKWRILDDFSNKVKHKNVFESNDAGLSKNYLNIKTENITYYG